MRRRKKAVYLKAADVEKRQCYGMLAREMSNVFGIDRACMRQLLKLQGFPGFSARSGKLLSPPEKRRFDGMLRVMEIERGLTKDE